MLNELHPREHAETTLAQLDDKQRENHALLFKLHDDISNEVKNQQAINDDLAQFVQRLRNTHDSIPPLSSDEVKQLYENTLQQLQPQFDDIIARQNEATHLHVQQEWPLKESVEDVNTLINQLKADALQQSELAKVKEDRALLYPQYNLSMSQFEQLLHKYSNNEPKSVGDVEQDSHAIADLLDRLRQLRQQFQAYLGWLLSCQYIPSDQLQQLVSPVEDSLQNIDNVIGQLTQLHAQMQSELAQHNNLKQQKESLSQRFEQINEEASKVHAIEDPDQRQTQLNLIQQQVQPLVEELHMVRQQMPETARPILSDNVENSQLLKKLHNNALDLQNTLGSDQKDAAKRIKLARIEDEAQFAMSQIADTISGAELLLNVDNGPSMSQLNDAALKLDQLPDQMSRVPRLYEDLEGGDEMSRKLKVCI